MESKKKLPYDPKEVSKEKRFRANLSDAFLSGDISGQRAHSLFADAEDAGASNVDDLAGNHQPGMNSARDLMRKLLKEHQWPHLYWASIPVWSEKEQQEKEELLPFLLPHEILHQFSQFSDISQFRNFDSLPTEDMEVLQRGADILQTEAEQLLPLGMWMDGVPCNWDRSHSLNVLTLNFPCLQGSKKNIRIPLFGLKQHFVVKHMDAMLKVFCWSLECLFLGIMPSQRHDGLPWGTDDPPQRKKWSGKPLQLQAMLTQFRGACFVAVSLCPSPCALSPCAQALIVNFFFKFQELVSLCPSPFCRRLEDAQGRFSFASAQ